MIYAIIAAILIILIGILFLPLKIEASYGEKYIPVKIFIAGIPVFKFTPKKTQKQPDRSPNEKAVKLEKDMWTIGERIKHFADLYTTTVRLLKKYVSIDSVKLQIDVGTGDAASTAISTGVLWGAVYGLLGIIGSIMYINKHDVHINPVYEKAEFSFDGKCIIKSSIAYIIFIAITILIKIKSRKGKEE